MTVIYNARIVNEGRSFVGYVAFDGEFITEVGEGSIQKEYPGDTVFYDAGGALLLPGVIDTHVHFREPGMTHKATIESESAAAVAGGVTSFLDMPNTNPAATTVEVIDLKKSIAEAKSYANYGFFIGATNSNLEELLAADYSEIPGVKLFMGSSTGNMLVDRREALERLFSEFHGVIAVHAEDEATIAANREWIMREYGENAPVELHPFFRLREACVRSSSLAVELARKYDSRLHLLHISTADEIDLLSQGGISSKRITAETCPHYLTFTAEDMLQPRGYVRKCNPAIKQAHDREALRHAVAEGFIDVIATDHAPHLLSEKEGSLFKAASGMPGVKFSLQIMLGMTVGDNPLLTVEQVVEKMSHNPARLYGIDRRGFIRPGYYADLVLVDPATRLPHTITDADVTSHVSYEGMMPGCTWTPYQGLSVSHRILSTLVNGSRVFDGNKVIPSARHPRPLHFRN